MSRIKELISSKAQWCTSDLRSEPKQLRSDGRHLEQLQCCYFHSWRARPNVRCRAGVDANDSEPQCRTRQRQQERSDGTVRSLQLSDGFRRLSHRRLHLLWFLFGLFHRTKPNLSLPHCACRLFRRRAPRRFRQLSAGVHPVGNPVPGRRAVGPFCRRRDKDIGATLRGMTLMPSTSGRAGIRLRVLRRSR